ncbi:hypothetical protein BEL05_02135 [Shewanella colwelliana]|uniref:NERD domain-containing protein n=1 Tax=Shewanella colwelliana TaxID=23 RepID=A0A1E5IYC0_SHECO|nr:NERD domain-containing protein [Shewanella colwelliana]OEG75571.1 hypothetical protein BEL05_02135 [Shewanella colwelliana]
MLDSGINYYEKLFLSLKGKALSECAYQLVIEAYLYRPPPKRSKAQPNQHEYFWNSNFLFDIPSELYQTDDFISALANYFSQEDVANEPFVSLLYRKSPDTVLIAIRRSQIVLNEQHSKWKEIERISSTNPDMLKSLLATCRAFQAAYVERQNLLKQLRAHFTELTFFELMSFSAVYSFKHIVEPAISFDGGSISTDSQLRALRTLTEWKLKHSSAEDLALSDSKIVESLKKYHIPLVFPSNKDNTHADFIFQRFEDLIKAQVELDEFISQSIHPFCFDDSIDFSVEKERLVLKKIEHNNDVTANDWIRDGNRLKALRGYWFNLAMDEFIASDMVTKQIGTAENHQNNQVAYVNAIASQLELQNVYGFTSDVTTTSGLCVNLFQALLAQELMTAFYQKNHIAAFVDMFIEVGNWQLAVSQLALEGAATGTNRFPITWSIWKEKVRNIVGWTISAKLPSGSIKAAEAIMDFWCLDISKHNKLLNRSLYLNLPQLTEKPIFKMGRYCVQLPWLMSSQYGAISAVNNLRRFANQRCSLKDETTRIENQLGDAFRRRGFVVLKSFEYPSPQGAEAGEIDLICSLDNTVFVIEVKSTFNRTTKTEIYYHRDRTLRKAGIQVRKKEKLVRDKLQEDKSLTSRLGLTTGEPRIIGLIADTSIEFDHQFFSGFMKVSIQELLIALADNAYLLCNQEKALLGRNEDSVAPSFARKPFTLYPKGFNAYEFVRVIEQSQVWNAFEHQPS